MRIPKLIADFLNNRFLKKQKHFFASIFLALFALLLFFTSPQSVNAANGGRVGGGSFSSPSMPRQNGYNSGYQENFGGYRSRGIGFPFILPFFGFGGGGLFGFLILFAITGTIINSIRKGIARTTNSQEAVEITKSRTASISQLQVALLASATFLQRDMKQIAQTSNTNTPDGLQKALQETTLALLRHPDQWAYGNIECGNVPFSAAESTFNKLSITERSKIDKEVISNVSGKIKSELKQSLSKGIDTQENEFIAVTLLLASKNTIGLNKDISFDSLKETLSTLGSTSSNDLLAFEVIWQPEGDGEILSSEKLLTSYPNLKHL